MFIVKKFAYPQFHCIDLYVHKIKYDNFLARVRYIEYDGGIRGIIGDGRIFINCYS
jgi:hypothetical protein